ncbi:MAG: DUF2927 domain-containing protein [Sulfuritalea sp.]|nr:DUF2927 domain-containing protein [Sulfuritalea sp.]
MDSFVEVALRSAYSTRKHSVRKWAVPVDYSIVHHVGDEMLHTRLIERHFRHLAEITGLSIQPAPSPVAANFIVVLTREESLVGDLLRYYGTHSTLQHEPLFRHSICMVMFATDRKGSIVRAVAVIPVDRARSRGVLASCLAEELTHAMGLPNDSPKMFPSIFSISSRQAYLTGLDVLLLRMLYDPRVKVGGDERNLRPILETIAGEFERDNGFGSAGQLAEEGGLAAFRLGAGE